MELDNPYIELGHWATLRVTITGSLSQPSYIESSDLSLASIGSSSSYSIINGRTTKSKTYLYRVIPNRKGELEIPTFYATDSNSTRVESNSLKLFVDVKSSTPSINPEDGGNDKPISLKLTPIDRDIYVGEAIEVEVIGFFSQKNGHSITKTPYVKKGNFSLELEGKPTQRTDVPINGSYWIEAKWKGYLTPISSGSQHLEIAMESDITYSTRSSSFFSSSRTKSLETLSRSQSILVLDLPESNRPDSFTGAIGNFTMTSSIDSENIIVGEPITYKLNIYGIGNFPRIQNPEIADSTHWKVYPPSSNFSGSNGSNFSGLKSFENIISPKTTNATNIPLFIFTYFDPLRKEYITIESDKETINVSEGAKLEVLSHPPKGIEYQDNGTLFKHINSPRALSNREYLRRVIQPIFIISLCLLGLSLILNILIKFNLIKVLKQRVNSRLDLSQLNKLEGVGNFNGAAIELYKLGLKDIFPDREDFSAITSEDLKEKGSIYTLATHIESIKYSNRELSEDEYLELKGLLVKERG